MGVPGFVAWLREYFKDRMILHSLPQMVDILYIDGNCMMHPKCFEVIANIAQFYDNITHDKMEEIMFQRIAKYITYLVDYVQPQKCYFAVDGVGPMAKINQQRFRRYKSIVDNDFKKKLKEKYNRNKGLAVANEWSNTVITPGTDFMVRLHNFLNKFFKNINKNNTNSTEYIYSSYLEPGEGEHKIMEHLRKEPDDTVSVVYGLDADLFFLTLASKKNNIYLLREEVHFVNGKVDKHELFDIIDDIAEDMRFVSIDILRDCYETRIKDIIIEKYNERYDQKYDNQYKMKNHFCDDLIFLCNLLGNDFIPHLPTIDIKKHGLDMIMDAYIDTYLNLHCELIKIDKNNKIINMIFFKEVIRILSEYEQRYYYEVLPKHKNKIARRQCPSQDPYEIELWNYENLRDQEIIDPIKCGNGPKDVWKFRYYEYYYGISASYNEFVATLAKEYLDGLKWITEYYYSGNPSWKWKYPFIHAPFLSDIYNFIDKTNYDINNVTFQLGEPLKPEIQLLAVLPKACSELIPLKYRKLMVDNESPISDLYPSYVKIDRLYHDANWNCLPLLPFLDIDRILNVTKDIK